MYGRNLSIVLPGVFIYLFIFFISAFSGPTTKVVFGDTIRSAPTANHVERTFSAIFTHPDYDAAAIQNDVALLKFDTPITFNDYVRPICLATLEEETDHYTSCYAVGWGRLTSGGGLSFKN